MFFTIFFRIFYSLFSLSDPAVAASHGGYHWED